MEQVTEHTIKTLYIISTFLKKVEPKKATILVLPFSKGKLINKI
jgi:hypothetical protein